MVQFVVPPEYFAAALTVATLAVLGPSLFATARIVRDRRDGAVRAATPMLAVVCYAIAVLVIAVVAFILLTYQIRLADIVLT